MMGDEMSPREISWPGVLGCRWAVLRRQRNLRGVDIEGLDFAVFFEVVGPCFCWGFWQKRVVWTWFFVVNLWWIAGENVVSRWWFFGVEKHATFSGFIFEGFPFWEFGLEDRSRDRGGHRHQPRRRDRRADGHQTVRQDHPHRHQIHPRRRPQHPGVELLTLLAQISARVLRSIGASSWVGSFITRAAPSENKIALATSWPRLNRI